MLAKQSWRLLINANPLVSEIMKARYYPKTDFLDAQMGHNPSYMWRSLMAAMEVLKAGARRKIGDGLSTKVWNVPWLPSSENGFMTTDMPHQMSQVLVNGFMCNEGKRWDLEVLNDVCNSRDMDLIKRIPIPLVDMQDSRYWYFEDSGHFTVKSCYRWIQGEMDDTNQKFWKILWSLKLPCKVTNFLWRVNKGVLPTLYALAGKVVIVNDRCPWCHNALETDVHVLFTCEFAKTVWYTAGLSQVFQSVQYSTAASVFQTVFQICNRE